ncbi:MAG: ribosome biogenesis GTPase Der, partial [bacterium]|nr:ribosome biogenesis GTPase Der [bacterium]
MGRANVGKSTLFNKIVKKRTAIVNDTPGVTRDRIYGSITWQGKSLTVVDTGGISSDSETTLESLVKEQAQLAMDEAECVIFVVDGQEGLTPEDKELIKEIRKSQKPLLLAVNKIDHPVHESRVYAFAELGFENIFPISAEHGTGIIDLMECATSLLPEAVAEEPSDAVKIALIGRPNVGKSSLINQLLKSGRCIVSDVPGTTRDTVDSDLIFNQKKYTLIDTAGIRRKGKTVQLLEKYSVIMSIKAIERCDIAVIVLDSEAGITDQDATIAGYAFEQGRGCIVLANKWDLVDTQEQPFSAFEEKVKRKLKFLEFAPILPVSAKTGEGVLKLFPLAEEVYGEYSKRISTVHL